MKSIGWWNMVAALVTSIAEVEVCRMRFSTATGATSEVVHEQDVDGDARSLMSTSIERYRLLHRSTDEYDGIGPRNYRSDRGKGGSR